MRLFPWALLIGFLFIGISSCTSYRKVPYLQVKDNAKEIIHRASYAEENQVRFQPDDVLSIVVNVSGGMPVTSTFNMPLYPSATAESVGENGVLNQGEGMQTYWVNKEGKIDFPMLGAVGVEGLTQQELESQLKVELRRYLKDEPMVTVRLVNFKISVLGEVNRPGVYTISKDHVNILEALSLAGDMTVYGQRDVVKLIREFPDSSTKIINLDLSDADVISSPYFYLHQNDQIYVIPNKAKAQSADTGSMTSILFSTVSALLSVAGIVVTILINKK